MWCHGLPCNRLGARVCSGFGVERCSSRLELEWRAPDVIKCKIWSFPAPYLASLSLDFGARVIFRGLKDESQKHRNGRPEQSSGSRELRVAILIYSLTFFANLRCPGMRRCAQITVWVQRPYITNIHGCGDGEVGLYFVYIFYHCCTESLICKCLDAQSTHRYKYTVYTRPVHLQLHCSSFHLPMVVKSCYSKQATGSTLASPELDLGRPRLLT